MSDIGALVNQALGTVATGIRAWGVGQEARRASEYQGALTFVNKSFSGLYQSLQRNPDYRQHETQFNDGADEILKSVTDGYLSDAFVRQRFELEWMPLRESVRQSAEAWTVQQEAVAIATDGMKNLLQTHENGGFAQAQQEAASIMAGLTETYILNPAEEEQYWAEWRRAGVPLLAQRLADAVEQRDKSAVRRHVSEAFAAEIIVSDEIAAQQVQNQDYAIDVGLARDAMKERIYARPTPEEGLDAAGELINPQDIIRTRTEILEQEIMFRNGVFSPIKTEDIQRLLQEVRFERNVAIARIAERRNEVDRQVDESISGMEADGKDQTIDGLREIISFIDKNADSMNRATWVRAHDRYNIMLDAMLADAADSDKKKREAEELLRRETYIGRFEMLMTTGVMDLNEGIDYLNQGLPQTGDDPKIEPSDFANLLSPTDYRTLVNFAENWSDDATWRAAVAQISSWAAGDGIKDEFRDMVVGQVSNRLKIHLRDQYWNYNEETGEVSLREDFDEKQFMQEIQNIYSEMTTEYRRGAAEDFDIDFDPNEIDFGQEKRATWLFGGWNRWDDAERQLRAYANGEFVGWESFDEDTKRGMQDLAASYGRTFRAHTGATIFEYSLTDEGYPMFEVATPDNFVAYVRVQINEEAKNEELAVYESTTDSWHPFQVTQRSVDGRILIPGYDSTTHRFEDVR